MTINHTFMCRSVCEIKNTCICKSGAKLQAVRVHQGCSRDKVLTIEQNLSTYLEKDSMFS